VTRPTAKPPAAADEVGWPEFRDWFHARWKQNEHVSILGVTQSGKTTLAGELLEARESVIVIATKPKDKVVDQFDRYGYRQQERLDVPTVENQSGRQIPHPAYRRITLWPKDRRDPMTRGWRSMRQMGAYQSARIREAMEYVSRAGNWTLFTDEVRYLAETCRLEPELKWLWQQSASSGISLMAATQRPSWVPRDMYSAPTHLFLFGTNDPDDLDRLRDIGGRVNRKQLEAEIETLQPHEWLYLAPHEHPPMMLRSKVNLKGQ